MIISKEKSYKIQMLRGLAIIAVVFIHNVPGVEPQVVCRPFLNFAVGFFLFLSGMLSNAGKWKPWKRIKKVLIPYLIWTAVYVVLLNLKTPLQIPKDYIIYLLTARSSGIMYFIFVYIQFTLLIPLIDKLAKSKFKYLGFVISPLEIIIMRLIPQIIGFEMNEYIEIAMFISCLAWFSYFYLGYMLGNGLLTVSISEKKLCVIFWIAFALQIIEGYWYYSMGNQNCGTQLKLSSIFTGCIFATLAYLYVESERYNEKKLLYLIGECSFGIYFSHLAIMYFLSKIPNYDVFVIFPVNSILALSISLGLILISKRVLGKYSKYIAF